MRLAQALTCLAAAALLCGAALAQEGRPIQTAAAPLPREKGAAAPPASEDALLTKPAKQVFGGVKEPSDGPAAPIGYYSKGCLAGAVELPPDGPTWQAMRLSRNRNWGHPRLVDFIQAYSRRVKESAGWPGILVGDLSQPRGGPMLSGHASHQVGLDVDVWLEPMPTRTLSREEREKKGAPNLVAGDWNDIDPERWNGSYTAMIKAAAEMPGVERVFVNAAIKKALCREAGSDRGWLRRVRAEYGHHDHIHVRLACPPGQENCRPQDPPPPGDGCGPELAWWFSEEARRPKKPVPPGPPLTLAGLPAECRGVAAAP